MLTILDAYISHVFWGSLDIAKRRAMFEAVNIGGMILDVCSIEIQGPSLIFVGAVPVDALEIGPGTTQDRLKIRCRGLGTFHTTWGDLMRPKGTIGFFVLRRPVTLVGVGPPDELDTVRVAMEVKRHFTSMPSGFIVGPVCCIECNEAIPDQRLKAIPGVRTCVKCQRIKEETEK